VNVLERAMRDRFLPEYERVHDVTVHRGNLASYVPRYEEAMRAVDPRTGRVMVEAPEDVPYTTFHWYDDDVSVEYRRPLAADEFPYLWDVLASRLRQLSEWSAFLETATPSDVVRSQYPTEDIRAMAWFLGVPGGVEEEVPRVAAAIKLCRRVRELTSA
jgi:hypothetical protein